VTRVVELVVNAAKEGIAEQDLQAALSKLYDKPPEHFDKLIDQIFSVKQPYTLLKNIKEDVANKHMAKLEEIGLECSIEVALALVPVGGESADDPAAPPTPTCPVCKEPTTSQDECTSCGVNLRKATSAKQSADAIQRTLENAKEELEKKKQLQAAELEKQRKEKKAQKEKAEKEKTEAANKAAEKPEVQDVFTAEYADEDDDKKRKVALAGAAAVLAAGVIAFSTGTFTSDPPIDSVASGDTDITAGTDNIAEGSDEAAEAGNASETGDANGDSATSTAAESDAVASAAPSASSAADSAAMTQSVVAAATAKVEAGTAGAGAADKFDEVIAKFENKAEMMGDNRSAEEMAQDLIANAHRNKALFQQAASRTGGAKGNLQMPSTMNGASAELQAADTVQQLEGDGSLNLGAAIAKYSGKSRDASSQSPSLQGVANSGTYRDAYLDHWVSRQAKAARLADLVTKLMQKGNADMAQQLIDETDDTWLSIHGQHKIAIAEQMAGDVDGSQDRMMNLFIDLMAVSDLPEKIAALADHAQTWHLMLSTTQADNAFDQMRSMAAAPMKPRQLITANVAMARSLKTAGEKSESRKHFDQALEAIHQVSTQNGARDEMIHFIALAEAASRFGDEALSHAGKIKDKNLRVAAYQSLYQTFSAKGMDRQASAALKKMGGANMPNIDRAKLEKMLKGGPTLSGLEQ
jgi:hypothetical protein